MKWAGLAAALVAGSLSATAGATCWNQGCDGKDSGVQGCRDGTQFTAASATIKTSTGSVIGHVDLVYSPTCGAAWSYAASAIGNVESVTAQVTRDDGTSNIFSPYSECTSCDAKRSPMAGDSSATEKAKATGALHVDAILSHPTFTASTSWF